MTPLVQEILATLPSLRRYAFALTGERRSGDRYIEVALETLLEEPERIRRGDDVRYKLYELFNDVLGILSPESDDVEPGLEDHVGLRSSLQALPLRSRKLLLLVTLEGFTLARAAELLRMPLTEARRELDAALSRLHQGRRPLQRAITRRERAPREPRTPMLRAQMHGPHLGRPG